MNINCLSYTNSYDSVIFVFLTVVTVLVNIIIRLIMEFITSSKGSLKLLYQGCSYAKQKDLVNNLESCECVHRRKSDTMYPGWRKCG